MLARSSSAKTARGASARTPSCLGRRRLAEALVELGSSRATASRSTWRCARRSPWPRRARTSGRCSCLSSRGFAAPAMRSGFEASDAKVVICADGSFRRGRWLLMRETVDEAGGDVAVIEWNWSAPSGPSSCGDSLEPFLRCRSIRSTPTCSRTRPARRVNRRACCTSTAASSFRSPAKSRYQTDVNEGDVVHFATDMGWIMGPWTVKPAGRARRDDRLRRGRPRLARRQALANGRAGARDHVGCLAHADPRAAPSGRAADRHLFRCG